MRFLDQTILVPAPLVGLRGLGRDDQRWVPQRRTPNNTSDASNDRTAMKIKSFYSANAWRLRRENIFRKLSAVYCRIGR